MRKFRFLMPIGFLLIIAAFSTIVMLLWNWLMPEIFGLATICFWQAVGLFILARIIFGGFGFGGRRHAMREHQRNHIREKWMKMTPEQRKEFIKRRKMFRFGRHCDKGFFDMDETPKQENENE